LWLPPVQQKIKDIVLSELIKKTDNRMSVGKISFRPFNSIRLEEVYISDLKGDSLLYAESLSAGFDLFGLLHNQVLVQSVNLNRFSICIRKDSPDSAFNFQFLIDAFASEKQDTTSSNWLILIQDIRLRSGKLSYEVVSEPGQSPGVFDYNSIFIHDVQGDFSINSTNSEHLEAAVKNLSFTESHNLEVQFRARLRTKGKKIELNDFVIKLPHSEFILPEAWIDYTGFESADLFKKGVYFVQLGNNYIDPEDVKMFYPPLASLSESLRFTGNLQGTFPQINVSQLEIDYGKHIRLNLLAFIDDVYQWKNSRINLRLEHLFADTYGIEEIGSLIAGGKTPKMPVNTGSIALNGCCKGSLSNMDVDITAQIDQGSLRLEGKGGYNFGSGISHFDTRLVTDRFDLRTLLQDTLWGYTSFQLEAKGTIGSSGNTQASGNINIDRCDFNQYSYHHIQANGFYTGDSIRIKIDSDDENLPFIVAGDVYLPHRKAHLYAQLDSVFLDPLSFLSDYGDAYLSSLIRADIEGFDPEKMNLNLSIANLTFTTDKGVFYEPDFKLHYQAADNSLKSLDISSKILHAKAGGIFTYTGMMETIRQAFPALFPEAKSIVKGQGVLTDSVDFRLAVNDTHLISEILNLPKAIPDSILFIGKYHNQGENLKISSSAFTLFQETDTLQLSLSLSKSSDKLSLIFNVDNRSSNYDFDGSIDADVQLIPRHGSRIPDMLINLNPTTFVLNETDFKLHPAQIEIQDKQYSIHNLLLEHDENEYVKMNGRISGLPEDSLSVSVSQFQLATIFGAIKSNLPLSGEAMGEIVAKQLLSTPFVLSRGFAVNNIVFAKNVIGDLNVRSGWSSEWQGLGLRATLGRKDQEPSVVSGVFLPEKDSLSLTANFRNLELKWLNSITEGTLYGLEGSLNTNMNIYGKIKEPVLTGIAYFDRAKMGISMLQTLYSIDDTIYLSPNRIELKKFTIKDETNQTLSANGKISYQHFTGFNPDISIGLSNFHVLNNQSRSDSLFFGDLRINGLLKAKKSNKDWLITGDITHADDSKVSVNVPSSANTAERYNSITFIQPEPKEKEIQEKAAKEKKTEEIADSKGFTLPLKINVSFWLDPGLEIKAIYNPVTGDAAQVTGSGSMNLVYDLNQSALSLWGDYEIESGKASLSLVNITRKTFAVEKGGKLTFHGDPMATTFDVTALYNLSADLASLDPSFAGIGLSSTMVPVTCSLTADGSIDKMELKYNILLPNQTKEVQKKMEGLLYTDELKIQEVAYLLAFGTFLSPDLNNTQSAGNSILTSLASSSITNQLNHLLSGVLSDNWSIGTNLRTADASFNDLDMDVNISTRLLNNRLTVNSTLGYHNTPNETNNFTGDFDIEYKLLPSGILLLKFFNTTNNQYYEKAKTTQGIGIVYKREAKTFQSLFGRFIKKNAKENEAKPK
jgi:hypothetical protein